MPPPPPATPDALPPGSVDARMRACIDTYWRRNVRLMGALLTVWAAAGLGGGVLLADTLNRYSVGGFPLGFWFAQQGSILVFVGLIGVYALAMRRLDRIHHAELSALARERDGRVAPGGTAAP